MEFGVSELIEGVREGRKSFLKHIDGVTDEQAVWKPYPQCKSIAETLDHLRWGDQAIVQCASTGADPDYSTVPSTPPSESVDELKSKLAESHEALMSFLVDKYGKTTDLTTPVSFYGHEMALGAVLAAMPVEESYHAGQAAFIRQATDPSWDYYEAIYS